VSLATRSEVRITSSSPKADRISRSSTTLLLDGISRLDALDESVFDAAMAPAQESVASV
jgi:hypothetical protein